MRILMRCTPQWQEPRFGKSRAMLTSAAAAVLMAGCASVSVHKERRDFSRLPESRAEAFFVRDFGIPPDAFEVNRSGGELRAYASREARDFSYLLVGELRETLGAAWRIPDGMMPDRPGWIIEGSFERVASGSVPLRIALGFGAGGSKMETVAKISQWSPGMRRHPTPFLEFHTVGGSGAAPGLVTALVDSPVRIPFLASGPLVVPMLVYNVGSKVYGESSKGVDDDAERTARMIVAALSEFMAEHGFISNEEAVRAKRDWTAIRYTPEEFVDWLEKKEKADGHWNARDRR